ncbi:MAG TPA: GGDEF domain-containing protein [Solirubrobacteraceae bacterium]|nr:GGDEF domain-containing protein [Solirubrobacteraceae bacterium]
MTVPAALRAIPRQVVVPVAVATLAGALLVLAGSRFGAAGLFFCVPVAVAALLVALRVEARQEGLRLISQQDALTGLGNRRVLQDRLRYEIARHRRHSRRFSVLALDLDGFKQVNDRFGHAAGDEILREVARALEKAVRDQDTVVRMGGDEFCVLAPEIGWEDAERLAERLELAVQTAVGGLEILGVSVGFAVFPDEGWTPEHLLSRADQAGIEAKRRTQRQLRAA